MKAVVFNRFGGPEVLQRIDRDVPEFGADEVLIEVSAVGVNPLDCKLRSGQLKMLSGEAFPLQVGADLCGTIEGVGSGIAGLAAGDVVYGTVNSHYKGGAMADKVATSYTNLARKPDSLSVESAAAVVTVALTAFQTFDTFSNVKAGDAVLINGASGNVGMFAVQFAKRLGLHVTASSSRDAVNAVTSRGADEVFDYRETDILSSGRTFDAVIDYSGSLATYEMAAPLLNPGAEFISTVPNPDLMKSAAKLVTATTSSDQLAMFADLFDAGELMPPDVKTFPMSEAPGAHGFVEIGRFAGKVVLVN